MDKQLKFELKEKPKKVLAFLAISFQLLAFFSSELGVTEQVKATFFGLAVFGYSFFILPHINVWQNSKN